MTVVMHVVVTGAALRGRLVGTMDGTGLTAVASMLETKAAAEYAMAFASARRASSASWLVNNWSPATTERGS
jgi:hypothetical protein